MTGTDAAFATGAAQTGQQITFGRIRIRIRVSGLIDNGAYKVAHPFDLAGHDGTTVTIGTQTPTVTVGVCGYDFRLKDVGTQLRPTQAGTVIVRSALGGLANSTFQMP